MSRLVSLHAGGTRESWQSLGLSFTGDVCLLADVELIVHGSTPGLHGWTIESNTHASPETHLEIDGIPTTIVSVAPAQPTQSTIGRQKIVGLDHVVVNTNNIDRTCEAITAALGLEVRRERDAGNGVKQRFHKLENTIIEVVSGPHITGDTASLWGMVASIDDLFDLADELGEDITSPPKRATQPGRYISTVRGSVGLGVPFALMTPHVRD